MKDLIEQYVGNFLDKLGISRLNWFQLQTRNLKHLYQKITRGFGDNQLWSLDYNLAKIIYPRLKAFKEYKRMGYPSDLKPNAWEDMLDDMVFAFKDILDDDIGFDEEKYKRREKGLRLFYERFGDLWD